jgi:hypothetical protein
MSLINHQNSQAIIFFAGVIQAKELQISTLMKIHLAIDKNSVAGCYILILAILITTSDR